MVLTLALTLATGRTRSKRVSQYQTYPLYVRVVVLGRPGAIEVCTVQRPQLTVISSDSHLPVVPSYCRWAQPRLTAPFFSGWAGHGAEAGPRHHVQPVDHAQALHRPAGERLAWVRVRARAMARARAGLGLRDLS